MELLSVGLFEVFLYNGGGLNKMAKKYCINCGAEINPARDICDGCIQRVLKNGKSKDIKVKG